MTLYIKPQGEPVSCEPYVNVLPGIGQISCPPNPIYQNMVIGGIVSDVDSSASTFSIGTKSTKVKTNLKLPDWLVDGIEVEIDFEKMEIRKVSNA